MPLHVNATMFFIFFTTVTRNGRRVLPVFSTSPATGYVTSAGFGSGVRNSKYVDARYGLAVPPGRVVMVSFPRVDIQAVNNQCRYNRVALHEVYAGARRLVACLCGAVVYQPSLHNTSLSLTMVTKQQAQRSGFNMSFSYHLASDAPVTRGDGLWNCSAAPVYETFKQHVHCNLARDCAGSEDEGEHCSFSSRLCNGSVAVGDKCYMLFRSDEALLWHEAEEACGSRGGILATARTEGERAAVRDLFRYSKWWSSAYIGLRKSVFAASLPVMYQNIWMWSDGVAELSAKVSYTTSQDLCVEVDPFFPERFAGKRCSLRQHGRYVCAFETEREASRSKGSINSAAIQDLGYKVKTVWSDYDVTVCPYGHVTFSFLSCEPASDCGTQVYRASCATPRYALVAGENYEKSNGNNTTTAPSHSSLTLANTVTVLMFACHDGKLTIPYSLVCDYVPHCPARHDETFCYHDDTCLEFTCHNGQCFSGAQKCDSAFDCVDRSDEMDCPPKHLPGNLQYIRFIPPPNIIDFNVRGKIKQRHLQASEPCPETHFRCEEGAETRCLVVYVRCNGVYDCPGREDEEDCPHYACPGFYRCRGSRVCVHSDHMCDGWPQCPQRDDELYCRLTCPQGCLCQGLAVLCSVKFPAHEYPQTRYLDASSSQMKPADLFHNTYLVWLSLASCSIAEVPELTWPNVVYLDLSRNNMGVARMDNFLSLPNLRTLILAGNPLVSIVGSSKRKTHTTVQGLDLFNTTLHAFNITALSCFPHITKLNLSYSPLDDITETFTPFQFLTSIDLRGSPVSNFPPGIIKTLNHLNIIYAANYKFCCKETLPESFDEKFCFADQDEISSCDDLLKYSLFRGCTWLLAALSVAGNFVCLLVKIFSGTKKSRSGFNVFVANLAVSDFLMGMYLVIVGVADAVYRGQYMWHDTAWKNSTSCVVAGFLSLLSSEMSALIICLITLDRFIVLTFPFTHIRFNSCSAAVASALAWTLAFLVVSVPLFPLSPRWDFYGQTSICIPLPITRATFRGSQYAFGVMIILNFIFFLLIAAGQASIYWSVRANSIVSDSSRKCRDLVIARRLFTVVVSDFLCWFPIGLFGLLSSTGMPVFGDVNVAMAIFVLPLNSALNPFLYTLNMVMERRRKARESQLIKMLEARILSQKMFPSVRRHDSEASY